MANFFISSASCPIRASINTPCVPPPPPTLSHHPKYFHLSRWFLLRRQVKDLRQFHGIRPLTRGSRSINYFILISSRKKEPQVARARVNLRKGDKERREPCSAEICRNGMTRGGEGREQGKVGVEKADDTNKTRTKCRAGCESFVWHCGARGLPSSLS